MFRFTLSTFVFRPTSDVAPMMPRCQDELDVWQLYRSNKVIILSVTKRCHAGCSTESVCLFACLALQKFPNDGPSQCGEDAETVSSEWSNKLAERCSIRDGGIYETAAVPDPDLAGAGGPRKAGRIRLKSLIKHHLV